MSKLIEDFWQNRIENAIYFLLFIKIVVSLVTGDYFFVDFLDKYRPIVHIPSHFDKVKMEIWICIILATAVSVYKYYFDILGACNHVLSNFKKIKRRKIHSALYYMCPIFEFFSIFIILKAIIIFLVEYDVSVRYGTLDLNNAVNNYLPPFQFDYLIFYMLSIDVILLLFCSDFLIEGGQDGSERAQKLRGYRRTFTASAVINIFAMVIYLFGLLLVNNLDIRPTEKSYWISIFIMGYIILGKYLISAMRFTSGNTAVVNAPVDR